MLVMIAVIMVIFLVMAVFSIDVAYMQLVRTELRAATDAAARAGTEALSRTQDSDVAVQVAIATAGRNNVANQPLILTVDEIDLGRSGADRNGQFQFTNSAQPYNSVRVRAEKSDQTAAGSIPSLLGSILGVDKFEPVQVATATHVDREICIVMDRSGSMAGTIYGGLPRGRSSCSRPHPRLSRWALAANAVSVFIDELQSTNIQARISMVSYSSNTRGCRRRYLVSQIDQPLTENYSRISVAMRRIGRNPIRGWTSISAGIDEGRGVLNGTGARTFAEKTMIVLTDGRHNRGREPIISARLAAQEGIKIHTITFSNDADIVRMRNVAAAAGGNHYHAPDADALREAFREIARTLPVVLTE